MSSVRQATTEAPYRFGVSGYIQRGGFLRDGLPQRKLQERGKERERKDQKKERARQKRRQKAKEKRKARQRQEENSVVSLFNAFLDLFESGGYLPSATVIFKRISLPSII